MSPPPALLAEAEAQKKARIDWYLHRAEIERGKTVLHIGQELRFFPDHPRWPVLVALAASPDLRGHDSQPASISLSPEESISRVWRISVNYALRSNVNSWEGPVSEAKVYACFENTP